MASAEKGKKKSIMPKAARATRATRTTRAAKETKEVKGKPAPAAKKGKDKNAPKRPLAAYMFYCQATREQIKETNPNASFTQIGKLLGEKWKTLSDEEKQVGVLGCKWINKW